MLVVQLMPPPSLASLQSGMVYLSVSGLARLLWKSGRRTGVVVCVTNYSGLHAVTICSALFLRYYRSSRTSRSPHDLELSFVPPGCRKQVCGLYALPLFLYFLTVSVGPVIRKSTILIFARCSSVLLELRL